MCFLEMLKDNNAVSRPRALFYYSYFCGWLQESLGELDFVNAQNLEKTND